MMKKLILLTIVFLLALMLPRTIRAQSGGGTCQGTQNECLCNPTNPNCCEVEGSNGYNCGGGGGGGNGGGGAQCTSPYAWGVNCPPGTVRGTTLLSSYCTGGTACGGPGTAQDWSTCCNWVNPRNECSDWYSCPTRNNPNKMCRDCTEAEPYCNRSLLKTFDCVPVCSATAPSNFSYSSTSQALTWSPGSGGSSQKLYVSTNQSEVDNSCAGLSSPSCLVNQTALSASTTSYNLAGLISPGTVFYAKVVTSSGSGCDVGTSTTPFLSSCSFSTPSVSISQGDSLPLALSVNSSPLITNTTFSSSDTGAIGVTSPDASYPYSTTLSGISSGTSTITSNVFFGSTLACTSTALANVASPDPWWQVVDGDVNAQGSLTSNVPSGNVFGLPGVGGYPGVPVYSSSSSFGEGSVSDTSWIAQSSSTQSRIFDFNFFEKQIPETTTVTTITDTSIDGNYLSTQGSISSDGYHWFLFDGTAGGTSNQDLTIAGDTDLGSRKVILLVKGADLNIGGTINLTDGVGFFLSVVNGATSIDPLVGNNFPDLEGLFVTDGIFSTGTLGNDSDSTLHIRGSVAGYGGMSLLRDLSDNSAVPGELFEYAPDQILLFPSKLGYRRINWKEVAP